MGAAGMIMTMRNNTRLLNKNNLFSHLKEVEQEKGYYQCTSLSAKEIEIKRKESKRTIRQDKIIQRAIGLLMLIPLCFVVSIICYMIVVKTFF